MDSPPSSDCLPAVVSCTGGVHGSALQVQREYIYYFVLLFIMHGPVLGRVACTFMSPTAS